jgi:nucleoside-diphosphate-sugar epimerase
VPVDETHPLAPQSFYAAHKVTAESYLGVFGRTHGLPFTILRVSNPYGPHQAQHSKSYGVINQFISLAARGKPIRVYGSGSQLRDYIYVEDVVNAFLLAASEEDCAGECFNLGGRRGIRLGNAATTIARLADGPPVEMVEWPDEYHAVETGDYLTDLGKIDSFISLPTQTSFEAGVSRSLEWYRREFAEVYAVSKVS